ncbi:hypothetical protein QBZ16_000236 [Prototheca wickerhamii]|uniref:Ysc84 actin-binding domain-containing protein n=1 Tax=Prototheca wickerhamii TaxID=3111 RepID=A0AAD9IMH5_PROWI|nr:hypothetical protein QBZ16_000236 [Prototheca wickerhamii]
MEHENVPAWAHEKLERRARKAVLFLQQLTSAQLDADGVTKNPTMPASAIVSSQGIAVLTRNKYGALVTVENEYGFLIRKLAGPRNEIRWSAPVFLRGHFMGAGFSGGYQKYRTCVALANEQARLWPVGALFLLDMNGTRIRRARFDSNDVGTAYEEDRYGGKTANYYQVEAAMVDVSIHGGGASVDKDFNAAVYGRETSVDEILSSGRAAQRSPGSRRREAAAPTRSIKPVRSIKMTSATASPEASPEQRDGQPLAS